MTSWSKALVALTALTAMALGPMLLAWDLVPYGALSGLKGLYPGIVPLVAYLAIALGPASRDPAKSSILFWVSLGVFLVIAAPPTPFFPMIIALLAEAHHQPLCFEYPLSLLLLSAAFLTAGAVVTRTVGKPRAAVILLVFAQAAFGVLLYGALVPVALFQAPSLSELCAEMAYR